VRAEAAYLGDDRFDGDQRAVGEVATGDDHRRNAPVPQPGLQPSSVKGAPSGLEENDLVGIEILRLTPQQ
jgi:hypothetical protein